MVADSRQRKKKRIFEKKWKFAGSCVFGNVYYQPGVWVPLRDFVKIRSGDPKCFNIAKCFGARLRWERTQVRSIICSQVARGALFDGGPVSITREPGAGQR